MDYYHLRSVVAANKRIFEIGHPMESFCVAEKPERPYIEQTFRKVDFGVERPSVILVSAVGATGKSMLAHVLSSDTGLPLFDLGKHKPVGDNTLTGLLTSAFLVEDLSAIFKGLGDGSYGVIIDGIDEGRSKTTEKAFDAFLDDMARHCISSASPSFILLGRTQILEDCWAYFSDKGISVGLVSIAPFSLDNAKKYINIFANANCDGGGSNYQLVRDAILERLGNAFETKGAVRSEDFLSFIGYPPVLDAISTLLRDERNYHKLLNNVIGSDSGNMETLLLRRIASYILGREKEQKVIPNIVAPLLVDVPDNIRDRICENVFSLEEQCMRLVSLCLGKPLLLQSISDSSINEKYEAQLVKFLEEHPFLNGKHFRNAVFESLALATLISSDNPKCAALVLEYARSHKNSYHLVYLLAAVVENSLVNSQYIHLILGSALEFRSTYSSVELRVDGVDTDDVLGSQVESNSLCVRIDVYVGREKENVKSFEFSSVLGDEDVIELGSSLSCAFISIPCKATISGSSELEMTAPVEISAKKLLISAKELVLKSVPGLQEKSEVIFDSEVIESSLESIVTNGVEFTMAVSNSSDMTYPSIKYVQPREHPPTDPQLRRKYFRMKRILMEFRSHSKGSLAKFKDKIEHRRVLQDDTGRAVLRQLLADGILTLSGSFYTLHPDGIDRHLGVSWHDMRRGRMGDRLLPYLRMIS